MARIVRSLSYGGWDGVSLLSASGETTEPLLGQLGGLVVRITDNAIGRTHACVDRSASGPNGQLSQCRRADPVGGGQQWDRVQRLTDC